MTSLTNSSDSALPALGDLPLLLVEPDRAIELGPAGVAIGLLTLGAWHISRVPRMPDSFGGHAAYLIRIPYDLDLQPGRPAPRRFEISFTFATGGASVHDALPQRAGGRVAVGSYLLNGQLAFARQDGTPADRVISDIVLPEDTVGGQVFGLGSATVRWRRGTAKTAPRSGSHLCWIVVLVPRDKDELLVLAEASFTLPDGSQDGLREMALADAFTIALPKDALPEDPPVLAHRASAGGKQVFVSYVHESAEHKADVKTMCRLLHTEGVTVLLDQEESAKRQDWQKWMTVGITRSDYVLVVASPVYRAVGLYETSKLTRRGIDAEYRLLTSLLAENYPMWLRKILPVVLPGRAVSEIPMVFQPYDADHYVIASLTQDGVKGLLKAISREPPP